jgi:hypothetical protein
VPSGGVSSGISASVRVRSFGKKSQGANEW